MSKEVVFIYPAGEILSARVGPKEVWDGSVGGTPRSGHEGAEGEVEACLFRTAGAGEVCVLMVEASVVWGEVAVAGTGSQQLAKEVTREGELARNTVGSQVQSSVGCGSFCRPGGVTSRPAAGV